MKKYAIVSSKESKKDPYPYIYITDEGSFRELTDEEKEDLECEYDPCDGARPYIKENYRQRDGWGSISGYLRRKSLPKGITNGLVPKKLAFWQG